MPIDPSSYMSQPLTNSKKSSLGRNKSSWRRAVDPAKIKNKKKEKNYS